MILHVSKHADMTPKLRRSFGRNSTGNHTCRIQNAGRLPAENAILCTIIREKYWVCNGAVNFCTRDLLGYRAALTTGRPAGTTLHCTALCGVKAFLRATWLKCVLSMCNTQAYVCRVLVYSLFSLYIGT